MESNFGGSIGGISSGAFSKKSYQFTYDFAVLGGAQGTIVLTALNGPLPNNLIIQNASLDILTILGSGGAATAALTTGQAAGDLVVAAGFGGAPWSTQGPKVTIPLFGTIGTWIKLTAQRSPALVVAAANLNAGKFNLFVEGMTSS